MYIACPKCDWRPHPRDLWLCTCGHTWHTFSTQGVCPACGKAWQETQCHLCGRWSDHEDWYHDDDGLTVEEYIASKERIAEPVTKP